VGGEERERLFARSRGLLMPIEWPESFGLVMVEALATGTPVIAFNRGSASEIVTHGETGFLVTNTEEMATAIGQLRQISPHACRASVEASFALPRVLESYEAAYATLCDTAERALKPR
jgi:glycosyltransferase involved in cell wall biosynthesis